MPTHPLADSITSWLLATETRQLPIPDTLDGLARHLEESGITIRRMRTSATTKHPEIFVRAYRWDSEGGTVTLERQRGIVTQGAFQNSPLVPLQRGADRVRCRLAGPDADLRFDVCREFAQEGLTDYVVYPLPFSSGERSYISFATDDPEGFSDTGLALLAAVVPALTVRLELESLTFALDSLLRVYLGNNAAERVRAGAFLRGTGQPIDAALWFCDMRGFTTLADQRPASEVVAILDHFFEAVAGPIAPHGGEVLKFIGDAVLAIFPVGPAGPADACRRALAAARDAAKGVEALVARDGLPELGFGIALHLGQVMYGNIGARERLDFTVIGAAVNEVCRVEALCRTLGPILMTEAFARHSESDAESRGTHALKGVSAPQEIFAPRR